MEALRKIEKEIIIKAPWGKIAALTWGSPSKPPVLLCHGRLDTCSGFRPLVSRLPTCFYYVGIDLPGNGRSDSLPKGVRYSTADLVPSLLNTVKHFDWKKFIFIGHSMGVNIGKLFNIAYPGMISRTVDLDPMPAFITWPTTSQGLKEWYHYYYSYYGDDTSYTKLSGGAETAPKYTFEKAQKLLMSSRELSKEAAEHILERCLEPAGDCLHRFTFDQRMKKVAFLPFSPEILQKIYTEAKTPTFCIVSKRMQNLGFYQLPFSLDESAWPHGNYKVKIVDGGHDVHIENPACLSDDVSKFMLEDLKT